MEDLEQACEPLRRPGASRRSAFFDLNGFKRYNDSFGHAAGDALLARIGEALRESIGGPRARLPAGRRRVLRAARRPPRPR